MSHDGGPKLARRWTEGRATVDRGSRDGGPRLARGWTEARARVDRSSRSRSPGVDPLSLTPLRRRREASGRESTWRRESLRAGVPPRGGEALRERQAVQGGGRTSASRPSRFGAGSCSRRSTMAASQGVRSDEAGRAVPAAEDRRGSGSSSSSRASTTRGAATRRSATSPRSGSRPNQPKWRKIEKGRLPSNPRCQPKRGSSTSSTRVG